MSKFSLLFDLYIFSFKKNKETNERNLKEREHNELDLRDTLRFITAQTLQQYKQLNDIRSVNRHLATLLKLGYITKRYDKSYKLRGKGASYCLTTKGSKYLWDRELIHLKARNNMYKNQSVKQPYVEHCLSIVRVWLKIEETYPPDEFSMFTRHDVTKFDDMPDSPPDLYINRMEKKEIIDEYFIDICTYLPIYKIKQKLVAYMNHESEEGWDGDYPTICVICREPRVEMSIQRFVEERLGGDLTVYTTNIRALMSGSKAIWRDCEEPEEQVEL